MSFKPDCSSSFSFSKGPLLIIGYGNTLRGDDGVGPKVAERIATLSLPGVQTLSCGLLTPELADPIAQAQVVVFVDAALDGSREVQLRKLAPAASSQIMAHAAEPGVLLALARDIFGHAPDAWWLTIPIKSTAIGEEFSLMAMQGAARAIDMIKDSFGVGQHTRVGKPGLSLLNEWCWKTSAHPGPSG